jgi:hypothetical protein
MASTTRKLPVSVSRDGFRADQREYLVPAATDEPRQFRGLTSGRFYPCGLLAAVGETVTEDQLYARLAESARPEEPPEQTLHMLEAFIRMLHHHEIGQVVAVRPSPSDSCGFNVVKVADQA